MDLHLGVMFATDQVKRHNLRVLVDSSVSADTLTGLTFILLVAAHSRVPL